MIHDQYVGAILAGQVAVEDSTDLKTIMPLDEDWKKDEELLKLYNDIRPMPVEKVCSVAQILCDSYNYSVGKEYTNKINAELREKDFKLMKEEKLRIEMEKSLRDIELKALHYQINPHFLFNVLNTIGRLAFFENAKMTEDVVYAFADMMRYILRKSADPLSPLADELAHVQNYLKVQKIRLGSRLQYSLNIPEKYMKVKVPFLSVTTLVENAVKYAVENKSLGGVVDVNAMEKDGDLYISVVDNGDGMSREKITSILRGDAYNSEREGSVGLYNVNSRLMHYFGNEYALMIESQNKPSMGTTVTIRVPIGKL